MSSGCFWFNLPFHQLFPSDFSDFPPGAWQPAALLDGCLGAATAADHAAHFAQPAAAARAAAALWLRLQSAGAKAGKGGNEKQWKKDEKGAANY